MAPEQRMGQPSAAADIYAMGLIARELLPGALPAATERLVARCLSRDPADRPVDARELGDQLYRSLSGSLVDSEVTRVTAPAPEARRGGRKLWLAGIVVTGVVLTSYFGNHTPVSPAPAERPVSVPDGAVELTFWNSVKDSSDPQMYRAYLAKYPEGQFAGLAQAKLAVLTTPDEPSTVAPAAEPPNEKEAWKDAKASDESESYQQYLNQFPRGKHETDARKKLAGFKKKEFKDSLKGGNSIMQEMNYWKAIEARGDASAYREYLAKYPNGPFVVLARRKLDGTLPSFPK